MCVNHRSVRVIGFGFSSAILHYSPQIDHSSASDTFKYLELS